MFLYYKSTCEYYSVCAVGCLSIAVVSSYPRGTLGMWNVAVWIDSDGEILVLDIAAWAPPRFSKSQPSLSKQKEKRANKKRNRNTYAVQKLKLASVC